MAFSLRLPVMLSFATMLSACLSSTTLEDWHTVKPAPTALAPCPGSPNCVLSTASDDVHRVAPLPLHGTGAASISRLRQIVTALPRTRVTLATPTYLRCEFTSLIWRFTDDVEFLYDAQAQVVQVRSASRVGYGDLGANRKRVEHLRALYAGNSESP